MVASFFSFSLQLKCLEKEKERDYSCTRKITSLCSFGGVVSASAAAACWLIDIHQSLNQSLNIN